jgi:hypothetical protein
MIAKQKALFLVLILLLSMPGNLFGQEARPPGQARNNCPITSDQILGQAFGSTAGAEGETGANGQTPDGEDIESNDLAMDAGWIAENLVYSASGSELVGILIMDDFSSDPDAEELSHGWLVYEVFEALLDHLPADAAAAITLTRINIADQDGFSSDLIVPRLQQTLDELAQQNIERFVLNMSFVFIPCEDPELNFDFNEFRDLRRQQPAVSLIQQVGSNRDYVLSLLNDARVAYIGRDRLSTDVEERLAPQAEARSQLERPTPPRGRPTAPPGRGPTPSFQERELGFLRLFDNLQLEEDPLRDFLNETSYFIVPVAAAGNFKQEEPFYPARWPEVISVSADEGNDVRFWLNSNNGEVTVPGAWNLFGDDVYRAGTSFAAPVLSTLLALDLTQPSPICDVVAGSPALAHDTFDNVLLPEAVEDFCRS